MRSLLPIVLAAGLALAAGAARADVCAAPFFHDGGRVVWSGTGMLQVSADLAFSDVSRTGAGACRARVRGNAAVRLAGLPAGKTRIDHIVTVRDGRSTFVRVGGDAPAAGGNELDLGLLGLFGYDRPVSGEGQRLPARSFMLKLGGADAGAAAPTGDLTVRLGEKVVGARQSIDTALGRKSCWPVRYGRVTDPAYATFSGVPLPVPGMRSQVTDWLCPDVNLVVRQEIEQSGQRSVIEVTEVR